MLKISDEPSEDKKSKTEEPKEKTLQGESRWKLCWKILSAEMRRIGHLRSGEKMSWFMLAEHSV